MNCQIKNSPKVVSVNGRWALIPLLLLSFIFCSCAKQMIIPKITPTSQEEKLFQKAESHFQQGDYEGALTHYSAYLTQHPSAARADDSLIKIATVYLFQNRYEEARYYFDRLIREYGASPFVEDAHLGILESYYREGNYTEAFERANSLPVDSLSQHGRMKLFKLLGDAYLASGSISNAVYAYGMGYYYADSSEKRGLLDMLMPAIRQLDSSEVETLIAGPEFLPKGYLLYQLGVNHIEEGQLVAAIDIFNRFLLQFPDHELAADAFEFIKEMGQISDDDRYAIGCLLPLTGPYQTYGERALRGIELALAQRYSQYSIPKIRLIVKDTASDSSRAVQAVSELYQAQVSAVIGPIITARAAAEAAQKHGLPMIVLSGKEAIVDIGDYVFRNFLTPQAQIKTIVPYLQSDLELNRFAILYPNEKYGNTFMNLFWDEIIANDGAVVGCESYRTDVTDFADPIKKLVGLYYEIPEELKLESLEAAEMSVESIEAENSGVLTEERHIGEALYNDASTEKFDALWDELDEEILKDEEDEGDVAPEDEEPKAIVDFDAVFIPDSPKKVGLIAPQLAYYDVENVIFVGTNLWHSKGLLQMARKYVQNAIMADGFYAESKLPHVQQFVQSYSAIYGDSPGFIEAVSYDTAAILFDLMSRPELLFRYSLKEALFRMDTYPGVTGKTSFDETGDADKELYLLQIKGGQFKEIAGSSQTETRP
jgi:ABC-type branched-subunit amino acid transport system substrate-binding protein/TolA-binding protein